MEMINIINKNKARKQQINKQNELKRLVKKEKISNILTFMGYMIGIYVFVEIVTLLVK
jgi:hypothetical protein